MRERSARPLALVVAVLLCWFESASSLAQQPPSSPPATAVPPRSGPLQTPALPAANPAGRGQPAPPPGGTPAVRTLEPLRPDERLDKVVTLQSAPTEPTDVRLPITLATALRLADARPIMVAATQASVWVAEAQLTRSRLLWVPTLNIGFDYTRHDGGGPDLNKGIMTAPSVNFFYGGAGAIRNVATADAIFQPLVARQNLNARHWEIQTAKNDALLATAMAYFTVHQSRGQYASALYCLERGHDLVERIAHLSRDLVSRVEVDRARSLVADLERQSVQARQEWRLRSADLTQVLRLDPRAVIVPLEHDHLQITLIEPGRVLGDLIPIGRTNRPEVAGRQAMVQQVIATHRTHDMVASEVTRAHTRLQSAALRVIQADRALRTGIITFNGNYERLQQTQRFGNVLVLVNRPQEAVFALQLMKLAFDEYYMTVADYNRAQFELFHAMGYPAQELSLKQPPGPVEPVNLERPNDLPLVDNGPPPVTP
jgi:hypothetical protein